MDWGFYVSSLFRWMLASSFLGFKATVVFVLKRAFNQLSVISTHSVGVSAQCF